MRNNLTKKEIGFVPAKELNYRYCRLLQKAETMPAHILTMADAREVLWIEDELHIRLIALIGHDFYPPEVAAKPTMAKLRTGSTRMLKPKPPPKPMPVYHTTQVIHPCSAGVVKKAEAEIKTKGKLRFKVAIINSLGSTVSTLNLHVDDKGNAEATARETITQLGLKKATFKIL